MNFEQVHDVEQQPGEVALSRGRGRCFGGVVMNFGGGPQIQQPMVPPPPVLPKARQPFDAHQVGCHKLGCMNVICPQCGAKHWEEEKTSRSTNQEKKFGMCCYSGKVKLPDLHEIPNELKQLLRNIDPVSNKFREEICRYNSSLAFTSVGQAPGVMNALIFHFIF